MDEKRLVDGTTALAEKQPRVIKIEAVDRPQNVRLRVAAYTRVSSDSEDQLNSFAAQNRYYTELISDKAEWRMVDIYADEGITGTSVTKRDDFQRMMADCRRGLIDQILVKSISRFARNTKDCLQNIRELKELGVNVRFEREGIDTVNVSSELITAIYAAFAQKESESISGNMRWSYQRRMESGTFLPPSTPYGYRIVNKKIEIDPERAVIICKVFQWYLDGISKEQIAHKLNEAGVLSNQNKAWRAGGIHYILTNERYIGDSLWQKTYTTEAIPTVRHRNTGAREQYYVEGTHPPIISKEVFTKVQTLIQMRKENYGKLPTETIHPLSRKVICGCCETVLRRKPQRGKYYWRCMRHDTNREECPLMPISETNLYESFCRLYYKLKHQSIPILEQMLTNLQLIRNHRVLWSPDIVAQNKRISDLSSQNQTLAFLKQQGLVDPDIFIAKTNELTKQLRQAKLEKEKLMDAESDMTALQTRDLIDLLEGGPEFLDSFDAELFGELVEKIIIESNDSVRFCLKNGLELRESIERTVR